MNENNQMQIVTGILCFIFLGFWVHNSSFYLIHFLIYNLKYSCKNHSFFFFQRNTCESVFPVLSWKYWEILERCPLHPIKHWYLYHILCNIAFIYISFRGISHIAQLSLALEGLYWNVEYGNGPRKGMLYVGYFEQCWVYLAHSLNAVFSDV